jgi:hypothetical protein
MIGDEFETVWEELIGRWGEGRPEFIERRKRAWKEAFGGERMLVMKAAIRDLEHRCARFPSMKDMHEAIEVVKHRDKMRAEPIVPGEVKPDVPMTPRERRAIARRLRETADRRCAEGRGNRDDAFCKGLYGLAELFDENAIRAERGEPIIGATAKGGWRPPTELAFGGEYGKAVNALLSDAWTPFRKYDPKRFAHLPFEEREFIDDSRELNS